MVSGSSGRHWKGTGSTGRHWEHMQALGGHRKHRKALRGQEALRKGEHGPEGKQEQGQDAADSRNTDRGWVGTELITQNINSIYRGVEGNKF